MADARNRHVEPARMDYREVLRAEIVAEGYGLNPLENGEEENVDQVRERFLREILEQFDREIEEARMERNNVPRHAKRPRRPNWGDERNKIGMWRLQNIEGLVGANDDTIFENMDNIGSLPREKIVEKTGLTPELFREHLAKARESGQCSF